MRRDEWLLFVHEYNISIHAPTRGATLEDPDSEWEYDKFQSTHPRGVRPYVLPINAAGFEISIHAPTRGATFCLVILLYLLVISIHAPTRGATELFFKDSKRWSNFNPRTHEGCDSFLRFLRFPNDLFQSTHPRGVRPGGILNLRHLSKNFNPRTHEGCDCIF